MTEPTDPRPGKYRRRPTTTEAIQWDGTAEAAERLDAWCGKKKYGDGSIGRVFIDHYDGNAVLFVAASDAYLTIGSGDWVAKDDEGFYPIKAEQFAKTYDLVGEPPQRHLFVALDHADAVANRATIVTTSDMAYTTDAAAAVLVAATRRRYTSVTYSPRASGGRYFDAIAAAARSRLADRSEPNP